MNNRSFIYNYLHQLSEVDIRAILADFMKDIERHVVEKPKVGSYIYIDMIPDEIIDKIKMKMDSVMKSNSK